MIVSLKILMEVKALTQTQDQDSVSLLNKLLLHYEEKLPLPKRDLLLEFETFITSIRTPRADPHQEFTPMQQSYYQGFDPLANLDCADSFD